MCRPFKVRVEQVLTTVPGGLGPGLLLTFRLSTLLKFYMSTLRAFLKPQAALFQTVRECNDLAERTFYDVLKSKGDKLVRHYGRVRGGRLQSTPRVAGTLRPPALRLRPKLRLAMPSLADTAASPTPDARSSMRADSTNITPPHTPVCRSWAHQPVAVPPTLNPQIAAQGGCGQLSGRRAAGLVLRMRHPTIADRSTRPPPLLQGGNPTGL